MAAKFKLFRDAEGMYRFQLKSANGEVVAHSQTYRSVSDARSGMAAVKSAAETAEVPTEDAEVETDEFIHMHY
jgi:uncharacterized protein YegP (UPF0339 family)